MYTAIRLASAIFLAVLISGCAGRGLIYTDVTVPYSKNFDSTPSGSKLCVVQRYTVKEPVSGYNITAEWDASVISAAAKQAGIKDIYYMDMRIIKIFFGIYKRETLMIYGE